MTAILTTHWPWTSSAILLFLGTLFCVGALPVYTVRLLVRFYPPDDPRRAELIAEMHQAIAYRDRWLWLFETAAVASIEGTAARLQARRHREQSLRKTLRAVGEFLGVIEDRGSGLIIGDPDNVGLDIIFTRKPDDRQWAQHAWLSWVAFELRQWIEECQEIEVEPFPLPLALQERWSAVDAGYRSP